MSARLAGRMRGRLLVAAALTTMLIAAPAAAGQAAKQATGSSWKTARTEEFSGSSLPQGCGAYGGTYTAGQSAWSSKDVDVNHGLLKLSLEKKKTSGQPYTSGGVGCWGWAQKYGRYEVRAKVPVGRGIDSYITLMPVKGGDTAWTGVELLAPVPETAYVTNGYGSASEGARVTGSYSGEFHTYVIEWAPKHIRITVDGEEIYYSTRSYPKSRWFALVVSNGDELTGVPDATTALPAQFQIDRVKVSAYTGVPPKARLTTLAPSRSRVAGVPTAMPTTQPPAAAQAPASTTSTPISSLEPVAADATPALAGGMWPWLVGGSLIAAGAAATLNHPRLRRKHPTSTLN
jgi:beta-glucanase (GH16 family)